jgi:hypothetical protein
MKTHWTILTKDVAGKTVFSKEEVQVYSLSKHSAFENLCVKMHDSFLGLEKLLPIIKEINLKRFDDNFKEIESWVIKTAIISKIDKNDEFIYLSVKGIFKKITF